MQAFTFEQLAYTSDHVWRGIDVEYGNKVLTGFTWNLQERGYSKADNENKYSNNPFNRSETRDDYEVRKIEQIKELEILCKRNDFGLLQEADFLFPDLTRNVAPDWLEHSMTALNIMFDYMLASVGFDICRDHSKEMAIIFKTSTLKLNVSFEAFDLPYKSKMDEKCVLFSNIFETTSGVEIRLGTMHGQFSLDYIQEIDNLKKKYNDKGILFIIGGDMNHPPNYLISDLLVLNKDEATNFFTNYYKTDPYTEVELDDFRCALPKAYDGFIIINPTDTKIQVSINGEHYWDKEIKDGYETPVLKCTTVKSVKIEV